MKRKDLVPVAAPAMCIAACICLAAMLPMPAFAAKGQCKGNTHWQCTVYATSQEGGAWYDPKTGQWYNKSCGCVANDGGSSGAFGPGSYGHAEIHERNVPTVKPSGPSGGGNALVTPSFRIAPRMPATGVARPAIPVGH